MKVLILVNSIHDLDENHYMFANGFRERGFTVAMGLINSLATHRYHVYCDAAPVTEPLELHGRLSEASTYQCAEEYDLIWVMNQPHPALAKDVWQILWLLSRRCKFVNSVESMVFLNNKHTLGLLVPPEHLAETHASSNFATLWDLYESRRGERWVVKPPNAGCGADVFLLNPGDSNARSILQSMTGNATAHSEITHGSLLGLQRKYSLLQQYLPEVALGEKRVVIAGGRVITQHGRRLADGDHRSNLTQGGRLIAAGLSEDEYRLCSALGVRLRQWGVNFIGLDLAYPYVLEFNIVNPGGLYDAHLVTGVDHTQAAIDAILTSVCGG